MERLSLSAEEQKGSGATARDSVRSEVMQEDQAGFEYNQVHFDPSFKNGEETREETKEKPKRNVFKVRPTLQTEASE